MGFIGWILNLLDGGGTPPAEVVITAYLSVAFEGTSASSCLFEGSSVLSLEWEHEIELGGVV